MEKKFAQLRQDLVAFPHNWILKVAFKEHPEGLSLEYFNNMENEGLNPSDPLAVGTTMKHSNTVMYRIELGRYKIIFRCHGTALKS